MVVDTVDYLSYPLGERRLDFLFYCYQCIVVVSAVRDYQDFYYLKPAIFAHTVCIPAE